MLFRFGLDLESGFGLVRCWVAGRVVCGLDLILGRRSQEIRVLIMFLDALLMGDPRESVF
jgi:hypothetical protein